MDQQTIKDLFTYQDGKLFWKQSGRGTSQTYKEAGSVNTSGGYRRICINKTNYLTHRLVYMMHFGKLPKYLDHINGIRTDNRIENLREATHSQNQCNRIYNGKSKAGVKGLCWHSREQRWSAKIQINHKKIYLGYYKSIELAENAVQEARKKYHGEFVNHG
jgi:hypothetical protein